MNATIFKIGICTQKSNLLHFLLTTFLCLIITSCDQTKSTQDQSKLTTESAKPDKGIQKLYNVDLTVPPPISEFVRRIFEDSNGNLWLGTNGDGVLRYDGKSLSRFSLEEGFDGLAIRAIVQDDDKNIWFGTERGLVKYDGQKFTSYNQDDGLAGENIWSLKLDKNGELWIGTIGGVSRYDGTTFTNVPLPDTEIDTQRGVSSSENVSSIFQDSEGILWFGKSGGAFMYDLGKKQITKHFSEKDGLANNGVNDILEDRNGNMWFATHHRGVSRYDGESFTNYTKDGIIKGDEVWSLFEDSKGNIWFPAENVGVYKYDGNTFTLYNEENGPGTNAVQTIYETRDGRIWFGGYKGLYRLEGDRIIEIFETGPWD
ncbi:hypothetical protein EAX61_14635 [Dokdonia sinensis]|uniref:Histidine kinase n=1 Tax=Dokdonia sinensis TaxID=2479847 RepID=A0A3M0FUI6_9FLAO|nr:two-component regulator propeller domain-containing protein [Dokdonia sinensis]RMB56321.1 hypothetical protein EAX61_14635 [Dokdonia sinensis]